MKFGSGDKYLKIEIWLDLELVLLRSLGREEQFLRMRQIYKISTLCNVWILRKSAVLGIIFGWVRCSLPFSLLWGTMSCNAPLISRQETICQWRLLEVRLGKLKDLLWPPDSWLAPWSSF